MSVKKKISKKVSTTKVVYRDKEATFKDRLDEYIKIENELIDSIDTNTKNLSAIKESTPALGLITEREYNSLEVNPAVYKASDTGVKSVYGVTYCPCDDNIPTAHKIFEFYRKDIIKSTGMEIAKFNMLCHIDAVDELIELFQVFKKEIGK